MCSTLLSSSHSILFPSRDIAYRFLHSCPLNFSLLILLAPSTTSLLSIHVLTSLTLNSTIGDLRCPVPFLSLTLYPTQNAAYPSSPAPYLSYSLPPLHRGPLPLLCTYINSCVRSMCYSTAENSSTFLLYPQSCPCHSRTSPFPYQFLHWGRSLPPQKL